MLEVIHSNQKYYRLFLEKLQGQGFILRNKFGYFPMYIDSNSPVAFCCKVDGSKVVSQTEEGAIEVLKDNFKDRLSLLSISIWDDM